MSEKERIQRVNELVSKFNKHTISDEEMFELAHLAGVPVTEETNVTLLGHLFKELLKENMEYGESLSYRVVDGTDSVSLLVVDQDGKEVGLISTPAHHSSCYLVAIPGIEIGPNHIFGFGKHGDKHFYCIFQSSDGSIIFQEREGTDCELGDRSVIQRKYDEYGNITEVVEYYSDDIKYGLGTFERSMLHMRSARICEGRPDLVYLRYVSGGYDFGITTNINIGFGSFGDLRSQQLIDSGYIETRKIIGAPVNGTDNYEEVNMPYGYYSQGIINVQNPEAREKILADLIRAGKLPPIK